MITSHIDKTVTNSNAGTFCHPVLSYTEHVEGWKLGIDYWADTWFACKNAVVEEFIEGKTVTAMGLTSYIGSVSNLPTENGVYAYDDLDWTFILLECNNSIYPHHKMSDSLLNPIQSEKFGVCVDKRPRRYYPDNVGFKSLHLPDGTIIPILYEGGLYYIPICSPTK